MSSASAETRCIAHVDMDAFYASIEQRDQPELRGLPVLVGGIGNRGVVAAASYEARHFGIRSAMTMAEARRRCPEAVCLRPRMAHYKDVSTLIFAVFREFTPDVEGLSLDEAFLEVTRSLALFGAPDALATRIKDRVREESGLTASVGIGPNKLVAKIASDLHKPDGLCILLGDHIQPALDPLPVRAIGGIGPQTAARLARIGIHTVRALREAPDGRLRRVFGRYATRIREKAAGVDQRPVCVHRPDQSISNEETFDRDISDRHAPRHALATLAERVGMRLQRKSLQCAVVSIKIRQHDFRTCSRQRHVSPPVGEPAPLLRVANELLDAWLCERPEARLRLLGVGVSELSPATQLKLFDNSADGRPLDDTLSSIRERFGDSAVVRGRLR